MSERRLGRLLASIHAWRWRAMVLGGALPLLLIGMSASAVANRLSFAIWAVVSAAGYVGALRWRWSRLGSDRRREACALVVLAGALALLALLMQFEGDHLDLGMRATLPALYEPALCRPLLWWLLAVILGVAGLTLAGQRASDADF